MLFAAYIDPSSMTYLIQIIAGVVIAAGAGFGFYWKRIKRRIRAKQEEKAGNAAAANADAQSVGEGETITADMLRDEAEHTTDDKQV